MKTSATLFLIVFGLLAACSNRNKIEPVVIHVYRDPDIAALQSALLAVGAMQLRSSSGQPVMIATMEPKSYVDGLPALGHQYHPELIIFDSPEDGEKTGVVVPAQQGIKISGMQICFVVPPWVAEEKRQTAGLILDAIRNELQKTSGAGTGASR
jgi:hypothetical protein